MNNFLISVFIGLAAAIIDCVPMFVKKLDIMFILSAFTMWMIVGILSSNFQLVKYPTLNGASIAILMFIPLSFLIYRLDRNAIAQVIISTLILGCSVGFISGLLIK
jgi:hypothetical protein